MLKLVRLGIIAITLAVSAACQAQPSNVVAQLERLASAGNAEAIYHLGMAYQRGTGVTADRVKALDAFRRAAALGDPLAAYKLGCYFAGQGEGLVEEDEAQALRYKLAAAEAGYALAQQDVAVIYARKGEGAKALTWIEKSAAQGWSEGLLTLSSMYNGLPGLQKDPAKTAAYFQLVLERSEPSDIQRKWLADFESKLSQDDRAKAAAIVRDFQPKPSPLTVKGLSGQRAAFALIERTP